MPRFSLGAHRLNLLACAAMFFAFSGGDALALSTGCIALNQSGTVQNNLPASDGFRTFGPYTGWEVGETVTLTLSNVTGSGTGINQLQTPGGSNTKIGILGSGRASYQMQASDAGISLWIVVDSGRTNGDSADYAVTCSALSTNVPNTDSDKVRSLQNSITKTIASTSAAAIGSAIDNGISNAFESGGDTPNIGPTGGFVGFASERRSETTKRAEEAFAALPSTSAYKSPIVKSPVLVEREWSMWADVRATGWKLSDNVGTGNDVKGNQINLTAGLSRKLDTDSLVGMIVSFENFKYDVAALGGSLKGHGETVGGYYARQYGKILRFDAALAWSNMNYSAAAGTAAGSFTGSRWLVTTGVTANQKFGALTVQPSVKLFMLWENQRAWTDTLGTLQTERKFSAGRTAVGAQASRPWLITSRWTISPYAGIYGDWRFSTDNALPTSSQVTNVKDGWSARVTSGLSVTALRGGTISLGGELGGLGSNYKIWSGNLRAAVPF